MAVRPHKTHAGWYYADVYVDGKRQLIVCTTYEEAVAVASGIKRKPLRQSYPTLNLIADEYLEWVKLNLAPATYRNKRDRLPRFILPALGQYRVSELSQILLDRYGATLTRSMYRADVVHLKSLITWMTKRDYCQPMPWRPEMPTVTSKIKPIPDPRDTIRTIEQIPYAPIRALFYLILYTGLRTNEVRHLRWEDYREDCIVLLTTKTQQPQVIPIPHKLAQWFADNRKTSGWVFESWRKPGHPIENLHGIMYDAAQKTGVYLTPHLLRHCSAVYLLEASGQIRMVQEHLRHSRASTTERYVRMSAVRKQRAVDILEHVVDSVDNGRQDKAALGAAL